MQNSQNTIKCRNPLVKTPMGNFIKTIGDAHLGQVFKNDVALDRRGEYEAFQYDVMMKELMAPLPEGLKRTNTVRCQVGDWFHKSVVPANVLLASHELCAEYEKHKNEFLYILSGNHDDSKTIAEKTSWDILELLVKPMTFIEAVKSWRVHQFFNGEQVLFIGWNVTTSAAEALMDAKHDGNSNITTVVCHLDKTSYGNEDNVIPYGFFAEQGIKMVISGHEHKPYHFYESGMEIIGTGSLLPFSHAEDHNDDIFLTFKSVPELEDYLKENPDTEHKHIRVYIEDGEEVPELNAYSLKVLKKEAMEVDLLTGETIVTVDSYDPQAIWQKTALDNLLSKEVTEQVWSEIKAQGVEE